MRTPTTLSKRLLLATGAPILALGLVELGFRLAGFRYDPSPMQLLVNGKDPLADATQADDDLFWTLKRSTTLRFIDLKVVTNDLGTRDALPPRAKTPGTIRIVCLGDSTAFGGQTTYPAQLSSILRDRVGDRVEVINAGVPGWTTFQGVQLFERDLLAWKPDIVTTSFGFNNLARKRDGLTDRQRAGMTGGFAGAVARIIKKLRCVQFVIKLRDSRRTAQVDYAPNRGELQMRCDPDDHVRCLRELKVLCDGIGAKLVVASEPHAFRWNESDVKPGIDPVTVHEIGTRLDEQNDAVERTARELGLPFVDLAATLDLSAPADVFADPLPGTDPLHTSAFGARVIAETLARFLLESKLVPGAASADVRPYAVTGTPATVAIDDDGDGLDEVLMAAVVDGAVSLRILDPRTGSCRVVPASLPVPDASFEIAQIPLLRGELVFFVPRKDKAGAVAFSRTIGARPGTLAPVWTMVPKDAAIQVAPFDPKGDGSTEYALAVTGIEGQPLVSFFDSSARFVGTASLARGDWTGGIRVTAIRTDADAFDSLYITPSFGRAFIATAQRSGKVDVLLHPVWMQRSGATELVSGRFFAGGRTQDLLLVQPVLVLAWDPDAGLGPAYFPVGSARCDIHAPRPVLAKLQLDGTTRIVLGIRSQHTIHLFECNGRGAKEWQAFDETGAQPPH